MTLFKGIQMACGVAAVVGLMATTAEVHANDKGQREKEALRRVQQALRTAQSEAATLQQEKSTLTQDKERLAQEKVRLDQAVLQTASRMNAALSSTRAASEQAELANARVAELTAQNQTIQTAKDALANQLREAQATVTSLRDLLTQSTAKHQVLVKRNQQLFEVGRSAVELYRSRDPQLTLADQSADLGSGVVRIENIAEIWLDRLEAARWQGEEQKP